MQDNHFDIIIAGAGPAGTTCALTLQNSGLRIGLFDKETFPRHKPCGDAIPGRAFKILQSIDTTFETELWENPKKEIITGSRVVGSNLKDFYIQWENKAYNSPRYDFDHYLLNMVKEHTDTEIHEGTGFIEAEVTNEKVLLKSIRTRETYTAGLVIGADGANSVIARKLAAYKVDKHHNSAAVRGYYSGVDGMQNGITELFILKKYLPGYFWVFPVGDDIVNAGFGMLSSAIVDKKININHAFQEFITVHPELKERFKNAELIGEIKGHNLPHGSRKVQISGERFMLIGDAASLIDPLDGHGIDKAILSGKLAAEQAMNCFKDIDFSSKVMFKYETQLRRMIDTEMQKNYQIMMIISKYPFVLNSAIRLSRFSSIKKMLLKTIFE